MTQRDDPAAPVLLHRTLAGRAEEPRVAPDGLASSTRLWLWLTASLAAPIGCSGPGTDLNQLVHVDPFPDGSAEGSAETAEAGADSSFADPFGGAPAFAAKTGNGSHNPGMSCIHSGCHSSTGGAGPVPSFLVGGTVYADYAGKVPAPGVEVRIVDSAGHAATTHSGPEGNFYIMSASANGVAFPAVIGARDAMTTRPMITVLTASMGSCGQAMCHVQGGGPMTNTGNYYPVHLP